MKVLVDNKEINGNQIVPRPMNFGQFNFENEIKIYQYRLELNIIELANKVGKLYTKFIEENIKDFSEFPPEDEMDFFLKRYIDKFYLNSFEEVINNGGETEMSIIFEKYLINEILEEFLVGGWFVKYIANSVDKVYINSNSLIIEGRAVQNKSEVFQ